MKLVNRFFFLPFAKMVVLMVVCGLWQQILCDVYRDCGGEVTNERGFIHTPNFPDPFPDPISCTWVIRAPPGKKIHLYFTQYFLREAVYLAQFDSYTSPHIFTGHHSLGSFDFEEEVTSVVIYKPVLTIEFRVRGKKNIHLRVEEFLTNVYGFNITYEVVDATQPKRNLTCSVHDCSFLGHCYAAADWSEFYCACFPGYFGPLCQFGPYCNPEAGLNTCKNGGSCRYFYGSDVNMCECPPDFTGVLCENPAAPLDHALMDEGCAILECSQLCDKDPHTGQAVCGCRESFRLHSDNRTCHLIERHLVVVNLLTRDTHYSQQDVLADDFAWGAQRQLDKILIHYRLPPSQRFQIEGFTKMAESLRTLRFHFLTDSSSFQTVELLLHMLAMRGSLFNFSLVDDGLQVSSSPELHLLELENYEKRAAPEWGFSNLLCRARGSNLMQFRWYKDGRLFNTSLTTRNVWNSRISEASTDRHIAILNINDITIHDKGRFTCEVEDFGVIERKDIDLDVVVSPAVVITPLAANVQQGESASFRCYTPDEREFTYTWLKNGELLNPRIHPVTLEDVQPSGKRLNILKAVKAANYTCVVSSHVTTSSSTVHLFVTTTDQWCQQSSALGVTWQSAVDGGFDQQKCPNPFHGLASRSCSCSAKGCQWSAPNLARCQTSVFISVFDEMEHLLLGYQGRSMKSILTELWDLLQNTSTQNLIAGDVTLASRIVLNGLTSAVTIPDILNSPYDNVSAEFLLDLLGFTIDLATLATTEERKEQRIVSRSLVSLEMIAELLGNALPFPENGSYNTSTLRADIKQYTVYTGTGSTTVSNITRMGQLINKQQADNNASLTNTVNVSRQTRAVTSDNENGSYARVENGSYVMNRTQRTGNLRMPKYITILPNSSEEHSIGAAGNHIADKKPIHVVEISHFIAMQLLDMPALNKSKESQWLALSGLHSVLPIGDLWGSQRYRTNLTISHPLSRSIFEQNETACLALLVDRDSLEQRWTNSRCEVLWSGTNFTTCFCALPVHMAVFVRPLVDSEQMDKWQTARSAILLVGCIVALCGITATLFIYLVSCRSVRSVFHVVRINFICSLLMLVAVCVTCLQGRHLAILCLTGRLLLHLSLLGAFAFLFVDSIHMYVIVHAQSPRVLSERCCKFFAIGWGIPVLSVGSTAMTSSRYGHNDKCYRWCWVESEVWQFYPFLVPMLVLVLACVLISVKCVLTVYTWTDEWRFKDRKKHILRTMKNVTIMVVLLGVTWTGCEVETEHGYGMQIVFIILLLILVGTVFTAYCVSERRMIEGLSIFLSPGDERFMKNCSSNSFRAFIMPEKVEDKSRSREKQHIHNLCTQRDNSRFTSERKRQLRILLGTSSGLDSSKESPNRTNVGENVAETVVSAEVYIPDMGEAAEASEAPSSQQKTDSGIYVTSDSEKSTASDRHHSHSNSDSDVSEALLSSQEAVLDKKNVL